jgi:hypothetical protein
MANKVIYYALPRSLCGKPLERRIISRIEAAGWTVVNPSARKHLDRVSQIKKDIQDPEAAEKAVTDYFVSLRQTCGGIAFTPFPNGSIGADVAQEAEHFVENKKVLMQASYNKEKGRVLLDRKDDLSSYRILSIDETRVMLTHMNPNCQPIPAL